MSPLVSDYFADVSTFHQSSQGPPLLPQWSFHSLFRWPLRDGQYSICSAVYCPPDHHSDLLIDLWLHALTRKPKIKKQESEQTLNSRADGWKWWHWKERRHLRGDFWWIWWHFRQRCRLDSILRSSHWEVHFCHKKNGRKKQWRNKVRFVKKHCWQLVGHEEDLK